MDPEIIEAYPGETVALKGEVGVDEDTGLDPVAPAPTVTITGATVALWGQEWGAEPIFSDVAVTGKDSGPGAVRRAWYSLDTAKPNGEAEKALSTGIYRLEMHIHATACAGTRPLCASV